MEQTQDHRPSTCESRNLEQLQALLLLISEASYESFSLMGERSQRSILSLAHDLSAKVAAGDSTAHKQ